MNAIGHKFNNARVMIVIVSGDGAHAWEVNPAEAEWEWTGVHPSLGSTARVTVTGPFRRRSRKLVSQVLGEIDEAIR